MKRSTRLLVAAIGVALLAFGVIDSKPEVKSSEPATRTIQTDGGTATRTMTMRQIASFSWHGLAAMLFGLGVIGYALLGRRRGGSPARDVGPS